MFTNSGRNEYGLEKLALLKISYWYEIWHIFTIYDPQYGNVENLHLYMLSPSQLKTFALV